MTINSSLFHTAIDESERDHGPDGKFQTAMLSSIGDLEESQVDVQTPNHDTEPFEETNIFKSNFEG